MARKKKFERNMHSVRDGIRFATPAEVAQYRAERLACDTLAEIGCGIGGQTIHFSRTCRKVYAVEIDADKLKSAKKNCQEHGITNVEFIQGDALSRDVIDRIPEIDILFSDPRRPAQENMRTVTSLEPGLPDLMQAYSSRTTNFAFEAPPKLTPERIRFDLEKEYLSLNGQLNRLTLYSGNIRKADRCAVTLPGGHRICSTDQEDQGNIPSLEDISSPLSYAFEPDPAVVQAGLLGELARRIEKGTTMPGLYRIDSKRILLTTDHPADDPMLKNRYIVHSVSEFDPEKLNTYLKSKGAGRVVLRAGVDPNQYWDIRNRLEKNLEGDRIIHLYVKNGQAIVCEKL